MSFKRHKEDKNLNLLKDMLQTKRDFNNAIIRFDGVYTLYDKEIVDNGHGGHDLLFLDNFIGFYKNGMVLNSSLLFYDSAIAVKWLKNFMLRDNAREAGEVGVFSIDKDTIDIVCYKSYGIDNGGVGNFITHFKGIIENPEAIYLNIVAPYPDVRPLHNQNIAPNTEVINTTYKFMAKKLVDSNNFWINKYK